MKEFTRLLRPVTRKAFETAKMKCLQCAIPRFLNYYGPGHMPSKKDLVVLEYGSTGKMVDHMLFELSVNINGTDCVHQFEIDFDKKNLEKGWYFVDDFREVPYRAY